MEVTIDEYGRIVIPKSIRARLGLEAGSSLELGVDASGERDESITPRPEGQEPPLRREGNLLVHTGRLTDETPTSLNSSERSVVSGLKVMHNHPNSHTSKRRHPAISRR